MGKYQVVLPFPEPFGDVIYGPFESEDEAKVEREKLLKRLVDSTRVDEVADDDK